MLLFLDLPNSKATHRISDLPSMFSGMFQNDEPPPLNKYKFLGCFKPTNKLSKLQINVRLRTTDEVQIHGCCNQSKL